MLSVTVGRVLGPYFFEDEAEYALAITGKRYIEMFENFVRPVSWTHQRYGGRNITGDDSCLKMSASVEEQNCGYLKIVIFKTK